MPARMLSSRRMWGLAAFALGLAALTAVWARPPQAPLAAGRGTAAPAAPVSVTVVAAQRNVIAWRPSDDPTRVSYRVYRALASGGPYSLIGTVAGNRATDLPSERRIYWYRVTAVDAAGDEGAPSAAVSSDNVDISLTIGRRGGTVEPTTGTVTLEIPPGAVATPTTFTIRELASPPPPGVNRILVSRAFEIEPHGTRFDPPAVLTLRYQIPEGFRLPASYPADTTAVQFWDPAGRDWVSLKGTAVRPLSSSVRTLLPHLSTFVAASITDPHGGYGNDTQLCQSCHEPHQGKGAHLFRRDTERETCYQCHDGSGANTDIRADFGEGTIGSSTKTSWHPVPAAKDGIQLQCSDCHTPHRLVSDDTKLLRVRSGGSDLYSPPGSPIGNAFCYACHGQASTLPAPFGDHTGFETSIHDTSAGVPEPPSGSGIKCLACHEPHASDNARLTTKDQEQLCLSCHTAAAPNTSGGSNPALAFGAAANDDTTSDGTPIRIYHHPVAASEQDNGTRVVECASCHNSHLVDGTDSATTSKIADPANTTQRWIVSWDPPSADMTRGNISIWCMKCHVNPSTTQPITAGPTVPYTVRMADDTALDADGNIHDKFEASQWTNWAKHGPSGANLACTACHDFHGSSNAYMLREKVVSPDGTSTSWVTGFRAIDADWQLLQNFCLTCHPTQSVDHEAGQLCTKCHYHGGPEL